MILFRKSFVAILQCKSLKWKVLNLVDSVQLKAIVHEYLPVDITVILNTQVSEPLSLAPDGWRSSFLQKTSIDKIIDLTFGDKFC